MNHVSNFKANQEKFSLLSSCVLEREKQNSFLFSTLNHWYGISTIHNTFFLVDKIFTFIKLKANQEHCKHSWMRIDAVSAGTANIFMFTILNFSFSIREEGKDKRISGTMTCSWWGHIKYPRRACKRPLNPYSVVLVYKSLGISRSLTTKPGKCIWYWFLLINVKNTYLENSVLIG